MITVDQLPANMQSKVVIELCPVAGLPGFCWGWTGYCMPNGYGQIGVDGIARLSHRVTYTLLVGPIPELLELDHLCTNRRCCNPAHLEPVTSKVNSERTAAANKTTCVNGHRLTPENTIIKRRKSGLTIRNCRTCAKDWQRSYRAARKQVAA